jgi:hypothetical protein
MKLTRYLPLFATSAALASAIACGSSTAQRTDKPATQKVPAIESASPRVVTLTNAATSLASPSRDPTDADYEQHVRDLSDRIRAKLPAQNFSIVIQRPFVVVGDESETAVQQRSSETVKWAVERLKQLYFKKDPNDILEIWLFKDDTSYRTNAKLLFDDNPSTPYGYYSRADKALLMNISTGSGTLVHEIVHPLMEANFPACPPWFNEGMGSLYEQSGELDGQIHGYVNWRLRGLQDSIREKRLVSFETLTAMDARTFYNDDHGNYAQSRYLCFYLQEKGLLQKFYWEFVKNQSGDPTGFKSLKKILGEPDMDSFKSRWEKFVLALQEGYAVRID